MEAAGPSEMMVPSTRLHGVIYQKDVILTCKQTLHIFRSPSIKCHVLNNVLLGLWAVSKE